MLDFSERTVVIVAPEGACAYRLVSAVRKAGCRVVIASVIPPDQSSVLQKFLHVAYDCERDGLCDRMIERSSMEELIAELRKEPRIDAVLPGSEYSVYDTDIMAEAFGVRGNPSKTSSMRRHKFAMKRAIAMAGLDFAKGRFVTSVTEALPIVGGELPYPVYVKEPEGAATHNVLRCGDEIELRHALSEIIGRRDDYGKVSNGAVVEEVLDGRECVVNMMGDERGVAITQVWTYEKISNAFANDIYYNEIIEDPQAPQFAELCEYARRLYRAVGLVIGPAHAEIKLTSRGPVAIEIGARLMGGLNETFTNHGMCVDVMQAMLRAYLTGDSGLMQPLELHDYVADAFFIPAAGGRVAGLSGLDEIRKWPSYLDEELFVAPGDRVTPGRNLDDVSAILWFRADTREEIVRILDEAHRTFALEVA